ncbi:hypothetical protein G6F57_006418 [Rhizopus arrhizus]|uniref:Uncharacterized protein n=1 Tax=Rhizopus oryzae TaxID=64495 RepID=A0A9P6X4K1_RHIOR|nr:hypothetical protein G6F23_011165 [Rhizopus arrhizus]KAG0759950.1 hypothetical protein G6F24_008686 [Rhizopus arrhizus]KAG0780296.1 hypothetical protein G6F22_010163 [Rhizopus arrhizus]KAG0815632.1 hypothetical protein G6F20_003838 [Rhizopus arrhizus]KAG0836867.1 hypothetical protein G6F19_004014 [Rhizopus arrhizus]
MQDKNILLTPQKANFVSSLYGGLKKNEEKHTRHKLDNNNSRTHRGNYIGGEKGFNNNNKSKYTNQSLHKRFNNNNNKRDNSSHHHSHHHHYNNQSNRMRSDEHNNERIPEWLDYESKEQQENTPVNDLELWKSSMKKKDGIDEKIEQKETEQAFSLLTLDQKNGFDDFFINETEMLPTRRDNQTGSRFAKFFAKREGEEEEVVQKEPTIEPRSISVNDLFGNNGITHQHQQHLQQQQKQQPIENNNNVRVLSEDDILQSLGAKKNSSNDKPVMNDAIGFNRVLQILSQPKPAIEEENRQQSSMPSTPINELPIPLTENKANSKPSTPTLSHHRFGNTNLPTAVLRQMSARSSPSLQTSKSSSNDSIRDAAPIKQQPVPFFPYQQPHFSPHQQQQMMDMFPMGQMVPPRPNGNSNIEQFLPPHMMMQPPPLPPGVPTNTAQRPMMPPHHHPLMQGQFPIQRDMMHPMPPYVMTNGIPPQLFNKTQGWERQ